MDTLHAPSSPDVGGAPTAAPFAPRPSLSDAPYRADARGVPERPPVRPAPFAPRELLALLAFVLAFDVACVADGAVRVGGFGLAVWLALVPLAAVVGMRRGRRSPRLALTVAMLVALALRSAVAPSPATMLTGVALVCALPFVLRTRRAFVPDALRAALFTVVLLASRAPRIWRGLERLGARLRVGRELVLPIVVPLALVLVFAGVFALANPVVADLVAAAFDMLSRIGLPTIGRVTLWGVAFVMGVACVRPALVHRHVSEAAGEDGALDDTHRLVARNALVLLNVLFAAYEVLDATYLWSGHPPDGMTTQAYAHQGALWLTIALALLTVVVGVMFAGSLAHDPRGRVVRGLAYAWVGQGLVLALGTYGRIAVHVAHSGLSDLRIVGILGTTLVVSGVALVALKLRRRRTFAWLLRRQLDALALTCVVYALAPTHWISAQVNVARIEAGEYGPLLHVGPEVHQLESAAAYLPLLEHPDARVRQGVAALLRSERKRLHDVVRAHVSWREQDLASRMALERLDAASPQIEDVLGGVSPDDAASEFRTLASRAASDRTRPVW